MNKYMVEMERFKRAFRKSEMREILGKHTPGDMHVMRGIEMLCVKTGADEVAVSDLVKLLEVPAPAVSRCMGQLDKEGLIERSLDGSDRRKTRVRLTDKGLREMENFGFMLETCIGSAVEKIGEEKLLEALELFSKLADQVDNEFQERKEEWKKEGRL